MHRHRCGRALMAGAVVAGLTTIAAGFFLDPIPQLRWLGGTGNWSVPDNWDPPVLPNPDQWVSQVSIDRSNPAASEVLLDTSAWVRHLAVDPDDTLRLLGGRTLKLNSPTQDGRLSNGGEIVFNGGGGLTQILLVSGYEARLRSGGVITLSDGAANWITGETGFEHLINENNTIQGAGRVGTNKLSILNLGTIDANAPYGTLRIDPNDEGCENRGLLRASNNGRLQIFNGDFDNANGTIEATGGGRVDFSGAIVSGGTLTTGDGGLLRAVDLPVTLHDLTQQGSFELGAAQLTLSGNIINDGAIDVVGDDSLNGDPPVGEILLDASSGPIRLLGDGTLTFAHGSSMRHATTSGAAFINGADHTISGSVVMDFNFVTLANNGTILADQPDLISMDLHNVIPSFNNGTLRATGFGGLVLYSGVFTNNGVVEVHNGSRIVFAAGVTLTNTSGGVLSGGTWNVFSQGAVTTLQTSSVDFLINEASVTLSGPGSQFPQFRFVVINDGEISILGGREYVTDTWFSNHGVLTVGTDSAFVVSQDFTQSNDGVLRLGLPAAGSEAVAAVLTVAGSASLGGTLELWTADGSTPEPGQSFEVLSAASASGGFVDVVSEFPVEVAYSGGTVTVTVVAPCPADFNGDGVVDSGDLFILFEHWGACPAPPNDCPWDLDDTGSVGVDDWLIVNDYWGPCP